MFQKAFKYKEGIHNLESHQNNNFYHPFQAHTDPM